MNSKKLRHFAIYSRKSKFTGKGESIENQIEMCRQYIEMHYGHDAAVTTKIYEDEGFSGGNLNRPQFKQMMKDSNETPFDALVVYRLDRISRNIGDFANLINELSERGIEFISIREQFDTSSPMGRAMMYIASVFSQLERETIAERIRDNLHELAKTGRWLGGNTPTGYESEGEISVTVDGKTKKAYKLKVIPAEKELVVMIFDKFMETGSLTKTDEYLLTNKIVTKNGNSFSRFAIKGILTNPVYLVADEDAYGYLNDNGISLFCGKESFNGKNGVMVYNRTLQRRGKANQIRPTNEWIAAVGKHEGFIPSAKWIRVQKLLENNRSKNYKKPRSSVALLSGVLRCANCGAYMRPKATRRFNAAGDPIYTYLCNTKERSHGEICAVKNVNGNALDEVVIGVIKRLGENKEELIKQLQAVRTRLLSESSRHDDSITSVKIKIVEEEQKVASLALSLAKAEGSVAEKYTIDLIEKSHEQIEMLNERLTALKSMAKQDELDDAEFDNVKRTLINFNQNIDSYSVEEKRAAIKMLLSKITWDGQTVRMYFFNRENEESNVIPFDFEPPIEPHKPLCEYSERNTDEFQGSEEAFFRNINK